MWENKNTTRLDQVWHTESIVMKKVTPTLFCVFVWHKIFTFLESVRVGVPNLFALAGRITFISASEFEIFYILQGRIHFS